MNITTGTRLGPYEVVAPIGAGGMGEVYRARDTRLDRSVAIKILPVEFAQNAHLKVRFEREAKTISSLNHPNICQLYDVGQHDGTDYLVMEYLEGETLAQRLTKGPLLLNQVLKVGIEIASALDKAHRQGVIHRDLKPSNIMLTKTGAKLLDFGLAKGQQPGGPIAGLTHAATEHKQLTEEGTILGTFQYMAPEQLEGKEADARTDLWALGAVLYEMVTGRKAFEGKSKTSLIAAIVDREPQPVSQLQPLTPPALEHVIRKCLAKEADDRWQNAHDVAEELQWIVEGGSQAGVAVRLVAKRKLRESIAWSLVAVLTLVAGFLAVRSVPRQERQARVVQFRIAPAPDTAVVPFDELGLALSPDGTRLAFSTLSRDGRRHLWLRSLDSLEARELPETSDAYYPFWSPDGRFIAFFADGKLKKIDAAGGPPQNICDAPTGRGGSWGPDGTILFAPNVYSAIYRVSASGGTVSLVTRLNPETDVTHRWPHFLPDGRRFLFVLRGKRGGGREPGRLLVASLESKETEVLLENATNAVYASGHLLFGRERNLMAQRFDPDRIELLGDPVRVVSEKLSFWEPKNLVVFTASGENSVVYLPEVSGMEQLRLLDRSGRELTNIGEPGLLSTGARFSPDGKWIAFVRGEEQISRRDIWLFDVARKRASRFTFAPSTYGTTAWSPDGSRLFFIYAPKGVPNIYQKAVKGSPAVAPLVENNFWKGVGSVSPDGTTIAFDQQSGETKEDLWLHRLGGKPTLFLRTPFEEYDPQFSPDGKWIAYVSDETGTHEIYIRSASGQGEQFQVSTGGGLASRWRRDGKELFFITPRGKVFAVPVSRSWSLEIGQPTELFDLELPSGVFEPVLQDVSSDGSQFLVKTTAKRREVSFHAVLNWPAVLKTESD